MTDRAAPRWRRYLRFIRPNVRGDVDDELAFHIQSRVERNIALGMLPEAARRDALERFGKLSVVRDALVSHDERKQSRTNRAEYLADVLHDLRFGARALRRAPGFTLAAAVTLALGIGANAAIFSLLNAVVLRPLPYREAEQLVTLGFGSAGEFFALRDRLRSVPQLAAWAPQTHPFDDGQDAARVDGAAVTVNLFSLLGAAPALGRAFTEQEAVIGNNTVLIISYGMWQRRFGGAQDVIGKRVSIEGLLCTIVGVMPPSFAYPSSDVEYWQPYAFNPANLGLHWAVGDKRFIGRLASGTTIGQARAEVRRVWPSLRRMNPLWDPGDSYRREATVTPLRDAVVGSTRSALWLMFGSALLVLLVACVNVANLLLARMTARERELAVRAALGGGRGRLIRQLVTESVLLCTVGGAGGMLVGYAAVHWLLSVMPLGLPRAEEVAVDGSVMLYTLLVSVAAGVMLGLVPAVRATSGHRFGAATAVSGRRATGSVSHARVSASLVAAQVALAVLLVVASLLLVRSFAALRAIDPGFATQHVVAARVTIPAARYKEGDRVLGFYQTILDRVASLPGARSVAAVDKLPLAQPVWGGAVRVEGQFEDATHSLPDVHHMQAITPDYFRTMQIPLLGGREFTDGDRDGQLPVVIVSRSFARRFWPNGNAVGKRIGYPFPSPWMTIVGIAADVRADSLRDTTAISVYLPWRQRSRLSIPEMWVVVRTNGEPASIGDAIRRIVREVDRAVPVSDVRTMTAVAAESVRKTRFVTTLVGAFALLSIVLGAVGIYGVMSYLVGQRTREMGIRIALGASSAGVMGLVVGRALRLALLGTAVGVIAAFFATRSLRQWLYGVSATDPVTFFAVPLLFLGVAALASSAPALRATRVDPAASLKAD